VIVIVIVIVDPADTDGRCSFHPFAQRYNASPDLFNQFLLTTIPQPTHRGKQMTEPVSTIGRSNSLCLSCFCETTLVTAIGMFVHGGGAVQPKPQWIGSDEQERSLLLLYAWNSKALYETY
jgi:hypothetical protein